jgi:hypothetical protein
MDRTLYKKLSLWVLAGCLLFMTACWDMPGCMGRHFPPVRDPHAYVLEVYQVEVPGRVGRGNPVIDEVLGTRRTKLLARFPHLKLKVGEETVIASDPTNASVRIQAQLDKVRQGYATVNMEAWLGTDGNTGTARTTIVQEQCPLDTWGTSTPQENPQRGTLRLLVFRLNSPG